MEENKTAPQERGAVDKKRYQLVDGTLVGLVVMIAIDLIVMFTCCNSVGDVLQVFCSLILLSASFAKCLALKNEK